MIDRETLKDLERNHTYKTRWEALSQLVEGLPAPMARLYLQALACTVLEEMSHNKERPA